MDFLKLAKKRYACRKYLSRQVEPEKLELILEAGRVAPTGANRQPQRLVVVQSKEGMERLARCTRDFGAPTAVIVCADTSEAWTRKYDGKNISDIDASIVTDHMMLAAASLNLDTLWICMFKPEAVREEFALPANVEPVNSATATARRPIPTATTRCANRSPRRSSTNVSDAAGRRIPTSFPRRRFRRLPASSCSAGGGIPPPAIFLRRSTFGSPDGFQRRRGLHGVRISWFRTDS